MPVMIDTTLGAAVRPLVRYLGRARLVAGLLDDDGAAAADNADKPQGLVLRPRELVDSVLLTACLWLEAHLRSGGGGALAAEASRDAARLQLRASRLLVGPNHLNVAEALLQLRAFCSGPRLAQSELGATESVLEGWYCLPPYPPPTPPPPTTAAALYHSRGLHSDALAVLWRGVCEATEFVALVASGAPVLAGVSTGAAEVAALMFQWRALSRVTAYVRSGGHAAPAAALRCVAQLLGGAYDFAGVALGLIALWPPLPTQQPGAAGFDPLEVCQLISSGAATPLRLRGDAALRLWLLRGAISGSEGDASSRAAAVSSLDMASVEASALDEDLFEAHRDELEGLGPPAPEAQRRHVLIAYLEHLVFACESRGADAATLLALQYVAAMRDAAARGGAAALKAPLLQRAPALVETDDFGGGSNVAAEDGEAAGDDLPESLEQRGAEFIVTHYRARLLALLSLPPPCLCDASVVMRALPPAGLAEERVRLLRALGQHGAAIAVLVRDVRDLDAAEDYCRAVSAVTAEGSAAGAAPSTISALAPYLASGSGQGSGGVHAHFVRAALEPSTGGDPPQPATVSRVLRFVSDNLANADPVAAARLLPASTPLGDVALFVERAVQHTHNTRRTLAIARQLAVLQWQRARGVLLQRQTGGRGGGGGACVIDRVTVCALCDRRLAPTGPEAFVRLPDGTLQHLACVSECHSRARS